MLLLLSLGLGVTPALATDADSLSGPALLRQGLAVIHEHALGAGAVDWPRLEAELLGCLPGDAPCSAAWPLLEQALVSLGDAHARFVPPAAPRAALPHDAAETTGEEPAPTAARDSATPTVPTLPVGQRLADGVAYVLVPSCTTGDVEALREYAVSLRQTVLDLADPAPAGWIVDLRLNGGGNVWPMLCGLRPLLGDGVLAGSLRPDGSRVTCGSRDGAVWLDQGAGPVIQLEIPLPVGDRVLEGARVAVLQHGWTMSSGEMVASAFRGQPGARSFGEPSAGLTTATEPFPLADGSVLQLPTSRMTDRVGRVFDGPLLPDQQLSSSDWPSPEDPVARAAREWLLQP
jgi:hypothetical protein